MIKGVHTMFYSSDPEGFRNFLRDKLHLKATDIGDGWLIFDLPEADMGCHPTTNSGSEPASGTQSISFYCDSINDTVAELKNLGVEFVDDIQNHGYGLVTHFKMPGEIVVQLYEPLYNK